MKRGRGGSVFTGRSQRDWSARAALALGAGVLAISGIASSLANVAAKADPARAHFLAPGNGKITAAYADSEFALAPASGADSLTARLAREALLQDATAVAALTVLGFQAQLRGEAERSHRLFALSWQLSRRDLRSQVWAIEDAVNRGDIAVALHHYDIALRTSTTTQSMLFPTLAAALAEPRIRDGVLRVLATEPVWGDAFIAYVATSGVEPEAALRLFAEGRSIGLNVPANERANFVNVLMDADRPDAAWDAYAQLRPGAVRNRSRDPNFALSAVTRSVFDWETGDEPSVSAAFLASGKKGLVDFAVPPSTGGVLLRQRQLLPPGTYLLSGQSQAIDQPQRSRPYWTLTCQDGRELERVDVPNSDENSGRFSGRFIVPQGCEMQTLSLIARSSDKTSGLSGQIVRAQLAPAD